ncbi:MAG: hypothetical protein QN120_10345 [Armatimonadota bacterium]|nr:hypothetical protein [Armatimonadota bacterium]
MGRWTLAALVVGLFFASGPVHAAGVAAVEVAAIGFDGRARLGAWTPVWIDLVATTDIDAIVVIEARAPTGQPVVRYGVPVRAAAGARIRVFVPVVFLDARYPGTVAIESGAARMAERPLPRLRAVDELVVVLSAEPLGIEAAAAAIGRLEVAYVSPDTLPPLWQAYEAVRMLVVRDLDERRLDDAQRAALREWVWTGGRVLVMPSGDDTRHLSGPTLGPLRVAGGRTGLGHVIEWAHDPADPAVRGGLAHARAWESVLEGAPPPVPPSLEPAVPTTRPVPVQIHLVAGLVVVSYILLVRHLSRRLASLRPLPVLTALIVVVVATVAAVRLSVLGRRYASGVASAVEIEAIPGTGHGLLRLHGRVVSSHARPFVVTAAPELLIRPSPPAAVTVMHGPRTALRGQGAGVQFAGTAVIPLPVFGTYRTTGGPANVTVFNRTGQPLEEPWVYASGRVQRAPPVGAWAQFVLNEQRWQSADRLQRTEPNHALLLWAFSRLGSGAILREIPAWLVGWWREPAWALAWDGRSEAPLQLVLIPLLASR